MFLFFYTHYSDVMKEEPEKERKSRAAEETLDATPPQVVLLAARKPL